MKLEKFSFGLGDRFLHQGRAQLQAILHARDAGVEITPVSVSYTHLTLPTKA